MCKECVSSIQWKFLPFIAVPKLPFKMSLTRLLEPSKMNLLNNESGKLWGKKRVFYCHHLALELNEGVGLFFTKVGTSEKAITLAGSEQWTVGPAGTMGQRVMAARTQCPALLAHSAQRSASGTRSAPAAITNRDQNLSLSSQPPFI